MANEFKIKKGLIVTGASGGTVVDIQGSQGQLFSVTDDLSGSIFAVSDISGVPIFDVNSSGNSYFDGEVSLKSRLNLQRSSAGATTLIQFKNENGVDRAHIDFGGTNEELSFFAGDGTTENITIDSSGDVGIGTTPETAGPTWRTLFVGASLSFIARKSATGSDSIVANNYYINSSNVDKKRVTGTSSRMFLDGDVLKFQNSASAAADSTVTWSERMRIDSDGNVGIGATSPASKLNVASTGANAYSATLDSASNMKGIRNVLTSNADDMVGIYFATGSSTTGTHWSGITGSRSDNASHWGTQLNFYTHNNDVANLNHATQKMVIKGNGNIGIGNDDPGAKLDVKGNYGDVIKAVSGSQNITTNFVAPSTGSGLNSIISTGGKLNIGTSDAQIFNLTTNSLSRISILSDGKVGIGTTSPSQKLEVAGSVAVTGTNVTVANASNPYIYINDTNAGAGIFQQEGNTTRIGSDSNTQVVLVQNNATAVTIDTSKNVGIGTTSPDYKLEVNGTLGVNRTDGIIFAGSAAAGYGNKITADTSNDFIFSTSLPSAPYTVSEKMRIANGGATTFTSTVTATNFILSSDERLKENIEKVCDNRVKADWKTFELKTEKGQKRYGVIAQELEKTNPEFVREDSQGFKSVAYIDLLIAKIAELEARLEKLEK